MDLHNHDQSQDQDLIKIGHITFFSEFDNRTRSKLLSSQNEACLHSTQCHIHDDKMINWSKLFSYMDQNEFQLLSIKYHKHQSKLFKNICVPVYTKLMNLYIKKCMIKNVEFLTFLIAESLMSVDLMENEIASIGVLEKVKWNSLKFIYLSGNPILQVEIYRMRMCEIFKVLKLQEPGDNLIGRDLSFVAKLPIKSFAQDIYLELNQIYNFRINQTLVINALKKKLPKLVLRKVLYPRGFQEYLIREWRLGNLNVEN